MTFSARALTTVLALGTCFLLPGKKIQAQTTQPLTDAQVLAALDPDMLKVVQTFNSIKGTPIIDLTPQDARQQFSAQDAAKIVARQSGAATQPTQVGRVIDNVTIPGPDSTFMQARIYVPAGQGPFPVVVYFHGGGFVIATINTYDESARALCNDAHAIVVAPEYRKAPESTYPSQVLDAIAAYQWTVGNIGNFGGNAQRIAVAGESAGGNLATELSILARDRGFQRPTAQILIYPITSSNLNQTSDFLYTSPLLPLNTPELPWFSNYYVGGANPNDPGIAPINANLTNLPPATIIAAQLDPLESDGEAYAAKLKAAGNNVTYMQYTGVTHEFFGMGAVVAKAKAAELFAAQQLDASF